jgi:hypothetical protein
VKLADHLLLADLDDLLKTVLPIIFMILYGVAQLVGGQQAKNKRKMPVDRPRPAPPEPPGAAPRQAGNQPNLEQTLRREVEEFLRRAQGQQPAPPAKRESGSRPQTAGPVRPPGRRPERAAPPRPQPPRRSEEVRRLTPASTPIAPLVTPSAQASPAPLGSGVARHVSEHLGGTAAIAEHARKLGAEVAQADERLQQHLEQKFVHQVGKLAPQATAPQRRTAAASPLAGELVKLLSQPESVRQMILAGEILRRPEERWS